MTAALEPIWAPLLFGVPLCILLWAAGRRERAEAARRRLGRGAVRVAREWREWMGTSS